MVRLGLCYIQVLCIGWREEALTREGGKVRLWSWYACVVFAYVLVGKALSKGVLDRVRLALCRT